MTTENKIPDFITDKVLIQVKTSDLLDFSYHDGGAHVHNYAGDVLELDYDKTYEQFRLAATRIHILNGARTKQEKDLTDLLAKIIAAHDNDAASSAAHIARQMIQHGVIKP